MADEKKVIVQFVNAEILVLESVRKISHLARALAYYTTLDAGLPSFWIR